MTENIVEVLRFVQQRAIKDIGTHGTGDNNPPLTSSFLAGCLLQLSHEWPKPKIFDHIPAVQMKDIDTLTKYLEVRLSLPANDGQIICNIVKVPVNGEDRRLIFYSPIPESKE